MRVTFFDKDKIVCENTQSFEINKIIRFVDNWSNTFFAKIVSIDPNEIECAVYFVPEIFNFKEFDYTYFENLELPLSATTIGRDYNFDKQTWLEDGVLATILTDLYVDIYKTKKILGSTKIDNLSYLNIATFVDICNKLSPKPVLFVVNELALDTKQLSSLNKDLKLQNIFITSVKTSFWLPELTDKIALEIANYYVNALDFEVILVTCEDFYGENINCFCTQSDDQNSSQKTLILPDNYKSESYF